MRRPLTEQIQKNRISRAGSGAGSGPRKQAVPQHHDGIFKYRYRGAGYRECRVRRGIRYSTSWPVSYGTLQGCRMSFRAFSQVRVTSNNSSAAKCIWLIIWASTICAADLGGEGSFDHVEFEAADTAASEALSTTTYYPRLSLLQVSLLCILLLGALRPPPHHC